MGECILDQIIGVIVFFRLQDYFLCLVCGLAALGVSKVRPHCRPFSWSDRTIDFPYGGTGTFPSWTLPIISVVPGVAYVVGEAVRHLWWERWQAARSRGGGSGVSSHEMSHLRASDVRRRGVRRGVAEEGRYRMASGRSKDIDEEEDARVGSPRRGQPPPPFTSIEVVKVEASATARNADPYAYEREEEEEAGVPPAPKADSQVASPRTATTSPVMKGAASPTLTGRFTGSPPSPSHPPSSASPQGRGNRAETTAYGSHLTSSSNDRSSPASPLRQRNGNEAGTRFAVPLTAPWQRFLTHAHMWVLTQAFAVTFAMLVVDAVKVYAGRLRPDFLSRLRREGYTAGSVEVDWCAVGRGGRVSFPSGHSAISFAAFVPFSFYVLHTLRVFHRSGASLWRVVVGLLPQILPITVAVSRTRDYRHNFDDILAGSLIGIASALIALGANLVVNGKTGQLIPRLPTRE
ncbi:putative Phosphatidic acid phosphatase [Leptomonas pyrrhocoris]|uniref:Putative Phosphatidic acid phosphatase n=1 Tax=Leptomonas pyrrhocoris TaxID=157538 RepID=A0A0M9FY43_LEPPY|nr:putative Phosphatidic acid phosphatase [Leptomonas pyrrhocoris]KPA78500.1 putative Phosphatidic acid phosphatase [Leptomonas pyrrhocoris]|eukprot:XP_015656939.1 putative Phosphatidic acid phosphatase [Leptomonas pyrrhocoris]